MTRDAEPLCVDARGLRCPWPALRLARAMRSVTAARLVSDDPRASEEVRSLAAQHGWTLTIEEENCVTQMLVLRAP